MWKRLRHLSQDNEENSSETLSDLSLSMLGAMMIAFTGYILKFRSEIVAAAVVVAPQAPMPIPQADPTLFGINGPMTNVVFCLDLSGSMVGLNSNQQIYSQSPEELTRRFVEVKDRLKRMVREYHFQNFSVIGFGGVPENLVAPRLIATTTTLMAATPDAREYACQQIDAWQAVGGTPTLPALKAAYGMPGVEHIVLLTDGLPTLGGTQEDVLAFVGGRGSARVSRRRQNTSPQIVIDVIGIGDQTLQANDTRAMALLDFTRRVAEVTGGFFQAW